ncbi:MAG: hypothetical protein ACKOAG_02790, partial [Candidatus Kapaibacterium sp.]
MQEALRRRAEEARVRSLQHYTLTIQNVDIKRFPEVSLIVEAMGDDNLPLDSLDPKGLSVVENGAEKKVLSVRKISVGERVPVDFV